MNSALRLILGLSILATAAGCDNGGGDNTTDTGGLKAVGGSSSTTGGTGTTTAGSSTVVPSAGTSTDTGGTGTGTGTGGSGTEAAGVPLTAADGWVDGMSNSLGIQGAMFSYADDTSKMGLVDDFMGADACIKGTAAKVDPKCTPPAGMDCYGATWGAAIGLNLNQPNDPVTMMGGMPMPFDASAITGFAFEITGAMVPAPASIRFKVENAAGEYCNTAMKPIKAGANTFMLADLISACWKPVTGAATGASAKSTLLKIAWQVVTNDKSAVPFDFCVANVRAITQ